MPVERASPTGHNTAVSGLFILRVVGGGFISRGILFSVLGDLRFFCGRLELFGQLFVLEDFFGCQCCVLCFFSQPFRLGTDRFTARLPFCFVFCARHIDGHGNGDFRVQRNAHFVQADGFDRRVQDDLVPGNRHAAFGDQSGDIAGW